MVNMFHLLAYYSTQGNGKGSLNNAQFLPLGACDARRDGHSIGYAKGKLIIFPRKYNKLTIMWFQLTLRMWQLTRQAKCEDGTYIHSISEVTSSFPKSGSSHVTLSSPVRIGVSLSTHLRDIAPAVKCLRVRLCFLPRSITKLWNMSLRKIRKSAYYTELFSCPFWDT